MNKQILSAALVAAAVATGCTANVAGSVNPNPSGSASPATGASAAPATGGGSVNVGATANLAMYRVGRKWTYENSSTAVGTTTTSTRTQEVTAINGNKVTLKTGITVMGNTTEATSEIDLGASANANANVWSGSVPNSSDYTYTNTSTTTEGITVKAGTYTATKTVGKLKYNGSSSSASGSAAASGDQDITAWTTNDIGVIKLMTSGSQTISGAAANRAVLQMPTGFPSGFTMPGTGAGGGMTFNFSMTEELVSFTP